MFIVSRDYNVNTISNMAAPTKSRTKKGVFKKSPRLSSLPNVPDHDIATEHNYVLGHTCDSEIGCEQCCPGISKLINSKKINTDSWKFGRRVIELDVLVRNLKSCHKCKMGPLYLTESSIKGEMKLGLGGYLYVQCSNCLFINRMEYGKTHKLQKKRGMPNFCINTKLGTGK